MKQPVQRAGTKQALLIAMLQAPRGATKEEIILATQWLAHTARGAMSGALGKKLGLVVTSAKEDGRGRVYRIVNRHPKLTPLGRRRLGPEPTELIMECRRIRP